MNTQSILRTDLKELYNLKGVCQSWKTVIEDCLKKDLFSSLLEIDEELIQAAFKAADPAQKKAMLKFFTKSLIITDTKDFSLILKAVNKTADDVFLIKNPKTPFDFSVNAFAGLYAVSQAYNNGWIPDWKNINEYKYFAYKNFSGGRWIVGVSFIYGDVSQPSGVYFKTRELAQASIDNFPDMYDQYLMISK